MLCRVYLSWVVIAAVVALAAAGCGGDGKVSVSGVVTLNSEPVEGAVVTFIPVEKNRGQVAHGTTGRDGTFRLTTSKPNDGAFPGEYKVTVVYAEGAEPPPAKGMKDAFTGFVKAQGQQRKAPKYRLPDHYGDPARSGLSQKVPPEGQVILALKSK
jgi:hypothetical protein